MPSIALAFKLQSEKFRHYMVIHLMGRLDADSYQQLDNAITRALKKTAHIVINFQELDYISSIGIGTLIKHLAPVKAQGGELWLVGLDHETRYVFEKLGLGSKFRIERGLRQLPSLS